jgi:hypothetical protein
MRTRPCLLAPFIIAVVGLAGNRNAKAVDYAQIPIKLVPKCLPSDERSLLLAKRDQLMTRLKNYNDQADHFLQRCGAVRSEETSLIQYCSGEQSRLQTLQGDIAKAASDFKSEVEQTAFAPAGEVMAAMEAASRELQALPPKDIEGEPKGRQPKGRPSRTRPAVTDNCRDFFDRVIQNLGRRRGKVGEEWENPSHGLSAHQVATALIKKHTKPGLWRQVDPVSEAQQLANQGAVVVAALPANLAEDRSHGHLAIVLPLPPSFDAEKFDPHHQKGTGPFVRDGNEHDLTDKGLGFALSSWGAVKASRATVSEETKWFLFVPSLCDDARDK